ncbi:MAG: ATP-dependent DNA ligase [Myxococcaceae bacterium]|nr:ATP-dependent DNA ligase [Myxococcaceae bacterium]
MKHLAITLDAVKATRSRLEKLALLAAFLKPLDDASLIAACRVIVGSPLAVGDARSLGVGWALLIEATLAASQLEEGALLHAARTAGDFGDGLEPLWPIEREGLPLGRVVDLFEGLAATESRDEKRALLTTALRRCAGGEAKYLVKALLGELRIGVQRGTLDDALALAFDLPAASVRAASALTPDVGTLALLVKHHRLNEATIEPGRVVAFMLATPTETVKEPVDPERTVVEDKLDGIRVQAHVVDGRVTLFARGTGEVTATFPDVVSALATLRGKVVLDGEVLAVTPDGGPRPFQALQARLGRTAPDFGALAQTPVAFVAYDVLFDGASLLAAPWSERRRRLEQLGVRVNPVTPLDASQPVDAQLETLFAAARARGHEGLMLKRTDAPYEAGSRGSAWRKVKRALATLDVVITRAERGHGKRAGVLSDYTFGVWDGEALVEIGKAYSGLTDVEIAALTTRLQTIAVGTDGRYLRVRPEIVLEVAFDGLQPSKRHDSGFALRFPRIVRLRDDKAPKDADRLDTVRTLFDAQVKSGHREASPQLGLFDDQPR